LTFVLTAKNKPSLLFLTHRAPYPPDRGDRIRSYHILRHLAVTHRVYLGALLDEPLADGAAAALQALTAEQALVPLGRYSRWARAAWSLAVGRSATEGLFASHEFTARVRHWAKTVHFDSVFAFCSSMVQFTELPELARVPLVVDLVDVDSQKWCDYAATASGLKKPLFALEARRVRHLECSLPQRVKAVTLVSEAEAEVYRAFCPNDKTVAVSNGVDLNYFTDQFPVVQPRPNQCVFVGVLDYRANVESLVWFCREVWPTVLARRPDAVFAIVGKSPAPAIRALGQQPGVRLIGPVPDVRPYIAESRFVVAPLLVARGIQNKVLEAMAMGKPVIASPQAVEGLAVTPDVHLLSAASASQQSEAMLQLYSNDLLVGALGKRAREFILARHDWSACLAPLNNVLRIATGNRAAVHASRPEPATTCSLV